MSFPDWRKIAPPPRLNRRPRDHRGFIIPFSIDDGTDHPDFRVTQPRQVRDLFERKACWLCGEPNDYWICFIGGPISIQNRSFTDGPMHEACAVYALRVCPFLASPNGRYTSPGESTDELRVNELVSNQRPDRFGLGFCRSYKLLVDPMGHLFMRAATFRKVVWYSQHGQLAAPPQIRRSTRYERKTPRYRLKRPTGAA